MNVSEFLETSILSHDQLVKKLDEADLSISFDPFSRPVLNRLMVGFHDLRGG